MEGREGRRQPTWAFGTMCVVESVRGLRGKVPFVCSIGVIYGKRNQVNNVVKK